MVVGHRYTGRYKHKNKFYDQWEAKGGERHEAM